MRDFFSEGWCWWITPASTAAALPGCPLAKVSPAILRRVTTRWSGAGRRPTVVKLMAEHADVFLWNDSPGKGVQDTYVVEPADLGVSPALTERLAAWNDRYGRLSLTDVEWPSREDEEVWLRSGLDLAHELQDELGPDVDVVYAEDDDPRPVRERRGR
jgi:hypothetical protein